MTAEIVKQHRQDSGPDTGPDTVPDSGPAGEQGDTIGSVVRSLAFYAAFYLGTVGFVLGSLAVRPLHRPLFMWIVEHWSAWHRVCVRYLLGIRIVFEGRPPEGSVLIAMKHEAFFEAIDLPWLFNRPVIFAKAELLRVPLWGKVGGAYGLVAVEREQGARAMRTMIAAARRYSTENRPFVIFPEGTRIPHGNQPPLMSGFAGLYKLLGLPVVPVAVDSGPCYHRRWKRRGTITIRFAPPIPAGLAREEIEARVHEAINALNPPAA